VVEGRARTISVWLVMLAISLAAALAAASTGEKTDAAGASKADGKTEAKAEAKPAGKGDAKPEAKSESKSEAKPKTETAKDDKKAESKADAKKDDANAAKPEAKAEAKKDAKPETKATAKGDTKKDAKADAKKDGKATEKSAATRTAKGGKSGESATAGEEPAGPITPPLKPNALREEMSHPPARHDEHAATKAEREKLEQLAAEINKAREGLRQDTAKLEAMLAARDAAPSPVASAGTLSNGENGEPAKKVPSPLDSLSKAIRGMKPEQAAPIISRVGRKLAADILLRMPGADAGKVMGVCKPEVAAEIAAEIASRTPHAELRR
jgi:flagellar motility protein MotE (MotC chaperone)